MTLEIDKIQIKKRLYKSLNIKTLKDFKKIKKKINELTDIEKYVLPTILFKLSQNDYNFKNHELNTFKKTLIFVQIIFKKILFVLKLIKNTFQNKNIDGDCNLIILAKHKNIDQINFFPLSNQIKKKHLVFFNLDGDYSKIYQKYKNNYIDLNNYINIFDYLNGLRNYHNAITKFNNIPIGHKSRDTVNNFYRSFFIKLEFFKRTLKNINPKFFLSSVYFGEEALIYYFKKIRNLKTKFYSLEINGVGGDSCRYLYYLADLVLVPGKIDIDIANELKKNHLDLIDIPKMKIVGNVRYQYWKKNICNKRKKNKKIKILFICSNPVYFKDPIEKNALEIFVRFSLKNPQFNYLIKERPKLKNMFYKSSSLNNDKIKIIMDENILIEDLINESDICVGTSSSALVRQALHQNKPVIQMFHNYSYMAKIEDHKNVDNYNKFENEIFNIIKNKRKKISNKLIINNNLDTIKTIERLFI